MQNGTTITYQGPNIIENQHIGNVVHNFLSDVQSQKVPYYIIEINQDDLSSTLKDLSASTTLQLSIRIKDTEFRIPFIEPTNFQELRNVDKLLLKGLRGVGKSRCAFELIHDYLKSNQGLARKILIINPTIDRPKELTVNELKGQISNDDIILWTDFPRGLPFKDTPSYGLQTLGLLTSLARKIYLTMDHEYLKSYEKLINSIVEPKVRSIFFDKRTFTKIIESYGNNIHLFREIFSGYIRTRLDEVSNILFEKEATPAMAETFYREALEKKSSGILNAPLIARNISTGLDYYADSFRFIKNNNPSESQFLYILKICYDLGLPRNLQNLKDLQESIFGNSSTFPASPTVNLDTFVTSTGGGQFSMNENLKNAISYPGEWAGPIIQYFFSKEYLDKIKENFSEQSLFGTFLGKNIHLISNQDSILPEYLKLFMIEHPGFLTGFSTGLGSIFEYIDYTQRRKVWKMVEDNNFIQLSLFACFGSRYLSLDDETKNKIWDMVEADNECRLGISMSIGAIFPSLDSDTRDRIWKIADYDIEFGTRVLTGITSVYPALGNDTKERIWDMIKNPLFSFMIGMSFGTNFPYFDDNTRQQILLNLHKNSAYCSGFYEGIGFNYMKFGIDWQHQLISNIPLEDNEVLFGVGLGFGFTSSDYDGQIKILNLADKHSNVRIGLAGPIGLKFESYEDEIKQRILSISLEDDQFELSLFPSFGMSFHNLKPGTQEHVLSRIGANQELAKSFGVFLGRNLIFVEYNLDKIESWMAEYEGFAEGIGEGIISIYPPLKDANKVKIWQLAETNNSFKSSLFYGFGINFLSFLNLKEILKQIIDKVQKPENEDDRINFFTGLFTVLPPVYENIRSGLSELLEAKAEFSAMLSFYLVEHLINSEGEYERYQIPLEDERFQDIISKSLSDYLTEFDYEFYQHLSQFFESNKKIEEKFNVRVSQISADNLQNFIMKAYLLYWQNKYQDSLSIINQVLDLEPKPDLEIFRGPDLYVLKGSCLISLNNPNDAINAYNEALEQDPTSVKALDGLASIYSDILYDYQKSYDIEKKLREIRGATSDKLAVVENLVEIKDFDKAITEAGNIISGSSLPGEKALANLFSACALFLKSDSSDAMEHIAEMLSLQTVMIDSEVNNRVTWNFEGLKKFLSGTNMKSEEKQLVFSLFPFFTADMSFQTESNPEANVQ